MIHIPDYLVGLYRMNQTKDQTLQATSKKLELDPGERGPLSYVAGYVVSKLNKTTWRKKNNRNEELPSFLQSLRFSDTQSEESTLIRDIPTENICNSTMNSSKAKSLRENVLLSTGVEQSSSTHRLCLKNILQLYLKVRSFSYARDYVPKYKIKTN